MWSSRSVSLVLIVMFVWLDVEQVAWRRLPLADAAAGVALKKFFKLFIGRGISMPLIVGLTAPHPA